MYREYSTLLLILAPGHPTACRVWQSKGRPYTVHGVSCMVGVYAWRCVVRPYLCMHLGWYSPCKCSSCSVQGKDTHKAERALVCRENAVACLGRCAPSALYSPQSAHNGIPNGGIHSPRQEGRSCWTGRSPSAPLGPPQPPLLLILLALPRTPLPCPHSGWRQPHCHPG